MFLCCVVGEQEQISWLFSANHFASYYIFALVLGFTILIFLGCLVMGWVGWSEEFGEVVGIFGGIVFETKVW